MIFLDLLDAAPAILVLSVGLVVLIRRRAALGRRGAMAISGVALLLAGTLVHVLLGVYVDLAVAARIFDLPWWIEAVNLVLLPADMLGLPLLAWAILAGGSPRPAVVTS